METISKQQIGAHWGTFGIYSNHFTGNYDGNGYKITNLNFTGDHNVGLFSVISGNIENLMLENISISSGSRVGGLAGRLWDDGTIRNTHIQGTGRIYGDFVIGGLVAFVNQKVVLPQICRIMETMV